MCYLINKLLINEEKWRDYLYFKDNNEKRGATAEACINRMKLDNDYNQNHQIKEELMTWYTQGTQNNDPKSLTHVLCNSKTIQNSRPATEERCIRRNCSIDNKRKMKGRLFNESPLAK